jgi:hypothetical protein
MIDKRHSAYCDARDFLSALSPDLGRGEEDLLTETISDLFFTDDPTEALLAFAAAEEQTVAIADDGRMTSHAARALLVAIANTGPEPVTEC